jgi:hypothetical protein
MTSATTVSVIDIEPEAAIPTNLNDKEKITTNSKRNNKKQKATSTTTEIPLRADDIKDYRLLTIASSILCFFIIAPFIALYHSRRIREMKKNQELKRAKICSNHVGNILIFSCIIGIVIWIAVFFLIGVLLIMGHFL